MTIVEKGNSNLMRITDIRVRFGLGGRRKFATGSLQSKIYFYYVTLVL
jgi:hypothetical protein